MIKVVQIRLVAETQADAHAAIAALRETVGSSRVAISTPHAGRKGGWLAYGTLQVDTSPPPSPATGPTIRLGEK